MSTTSTATTSDMHNATLGDAHDLVNHVCILVATQGNGTVFSPNSFQEEDWMELYMGLGQAHPDSVFQMLGNKALVAFCSIAKMIAATCLLGAATAWHDEPIRLCTHCPTTTHLRAYVAERGACLSDTQTPAPGREVVSWLPLATLPLRRGPHLLSRWPLGTLGMAIWDS